MTTWAAERTELAAGRILDVAEELFARDGVAAVTMRDLAGAVGCSRATLYRYFPNKTAVAAAYIEREAERMAAHIHALDSGARTPEEKVLGAITTAVDGVRGNRALAAWFTADAAATSAAMALLSPAIESISTRFLAGILPDDADLGARARFMVRIILSLLTTPETDEPTMLERFVIPALLAERDAT